MIYAINFIYMNHMLYINTFYIYMLDCHKKKSEILVITQQKKMCIVIPKGRAKKNL
jgi:hypothetical protein